MVGEPRAVLIALQRLGAGFPNGVGQGAARDGRSPPSFGCARLADLRDCRSNDPSRSLLKRHAATGNYPPCPCRPRARRVARATTKSYSRESSLASPVIPSGRKKGRNLALLETAEGQGFGGVLDGVHAVSGGDGAHDGAGCNAGVGLGKAGVFVALVPLSAPATLQRLPR